MERLIGRFGFSGSLCRRGSLWHDKDGSEEEAIMFRVLFLSEVFLLFFLKRVSASH